MERVDLRRGRLLLTPPTAEDLDRITELCQDPAIQRWTVVPVPYTRSDAQFYLTEVADAGWAAGSPQWTLRLLPEEYAEVGTTTADLPREAIEASVLHGTFALRDQGAGAYEVGYWLGADGRGAGWMTAALRLVMEFAVEQLGARLLTWACWVDGEEVNWPSWKVAWQCGFRLEGRRRLGGVRRGERLDELVGTWVAGDPTTPVQPWTGPVTGAVGAHPAMPDPRDPEALVRQFHETYALPVSDGAPSVDSERVHMRMGLITEECAELVGAVYGQEAERIVLEAVARAVAADDGTRDTVEAADALADLTYVVYGMALEMGIPMEWVLAEVQASNLSKLGEDGKPIYREDGKVLKGPGFRAPDVAAVLQRWQEFGRPRDLGRP